MHVSKCLTKPKGMFLIILCRRQPLCVRMAGDVECMERQIFARSRGKVRSLTLREIFDLFLKNILMFRLCYRSYLQAHRMRTHQQYQRGSKSMSSSVHRGLPGMGWGGQIKKQNNTFFFIKFTGGNNKEVLA